MRPRYTHPTTEQKATLRAIHEYSQSHGFAPSIRDVMRLTNGTSSGVTRYRMLALESMGYLVRGSKARALGLTHKAYELMGIQSPAVIVLPAPISSDTPEEASNWRSEIRALHERIKRMRDIRPLKGEEYCAGRADAIDALLKELDGVLRKRR